MASQVGSSTMEITMFVCEKAADRDKWVIGLNAFLRVEESPDEDEEALYREARSSQHLQNSTGPLLGLFPVTSVSLPPLTQCRGSVSGGGAARELYEKHQTKNHPNKGRIFSGDGRSDRG